MTVAAWQWWARTWSYAAVFCCGGAVAAFDDSSWSWLSAAVLAGLAAIICEHQAAWYRRHRGQDER